MVHTEHFPMHLINSEWNVKHNQNTSSVYWSCELWKWVANNKSGDLTRIEFQRFGNCVYETNIWLAPKLLPWTIWMSACHLLYITFRYWIGKRWHFDSFQKRIGGMNESVLMHPFGVCQESECKKNKQFILIQFPFKNIHISWTDKCE